MNHTEATDFIVVGQIDSNQLANAEGTLAYMEQFSLQFLLTLLFLIVLKICL